MNAVDDILLIQTNITNDNRFVIVDDRAVFATVKRCQTLNVQVSSNFCLSNFGLVEG